MYDGRFMEEFNEAEFKLKAVSVLKTFILPFAGGDGRSGQRGDR